MQRAVANMFRRLKNDKWEVFDADADPDTVCAMISDAAMPVLATVKETDASQIRTG